MLFDQSHHMTDLFLRGPDALRLLSGLGVNSFANFGPGRAKQYVAVNADGYLIGDAILLPPRGRTCSTWWVTRRSPTGCSTTWRAGDWDVTVERDDNSVDRPAGTRPALYRYELQGPTAGAIAAEATAGRCPT